ncbi:phospho-N-acetylmuramoyl-pentapeptide-transferase [Patescibacteria group bacterium]|nr:phospho-N-acetylmuramoyl-pentapeptide-transferase [Patescibacteria group bacterium]MBU1448634.1 phospho-N-acetylmuramoyl-pentapeptide-transferase [Patescibacteria group bacterium]MBU2613086.1 phospho-N-acetylmuramoyl-pentapeptide-transferase [Patescibacteria group bacterium]
MTPAIADILKILVIAVLCFGIALVWTPWFIRWLKRHKMGKTIRDAASAPIAAKLHAAKAGTPTMGGVVIWVTVSAVILFFAGGCDWLHLDAACQLNFLSRGQTLLPLGALVAAALVGLVDDYFNIRRIGPAGGGLRMRHRLLSYTLIALVAAVWFFTKLDWDVVHIPFAGDIPFGLWYIPFFAFVIVATSFSVNETDGLDGLAGGTLLAAFGAYGVIAFSTGKVDLAAFCAAIFGALLAFVWHNVTPAAFFMGDTGAMALGTVLGIVAMLTNQPLLLPLIGLPFVVESASVLMQVTSKKLRNGKKIFRSSPLHHHLEAIGWGEPKIVMRFWVVSFVCAWIGVAIALIDRT